MLFQCQFLSTSFLQVVQARGSLFLTRFLLPSLAGLGHCREAGGGPQLGRAGCDDPSETARGAEN